MANVAKRTWTHKGAQKTAWTVRYVDAGGSHRQRTFERKKDAELYRSKVETEMARGGHAPAAELLTIKAVSEAMLSAMDEKVKDGRIGRSHELRTRRHIAKHVLPEIGMMRLDKVTISTLEAWHRRLRGEKRLAVRTARHVVQTLKMIFDHAVRREWIHRNPVPLFLSELKGQRIEPVRSFTTDQVRQLLTAADAPMYRGRVAIAHLRTQIAVNLAAFCGLRKGEIFGLRIASIDFDKRQITIANSLSKHDGLKGPKTEAGRRTIAMPDHVAGLLRAWIARFAVKNKEGLLFSTKEGKPFNADGWRHGSWGPLLKRAGLSADSKHPEFHFHALRHFAASFMIEEGWSLPDVAKALGHAKVDMTLSVYAHALGDRGADSAQMQALSDRLRAPPTPPALSFQRANCA